MGSFLFILILIRLFTFSFDKYLFHCPLEAKYLEYGNANFFNFLEGKMKANIISFIVALWTKWASQLVLVVKNPPANEGDIWKVGSIPGSRRSPRGRNGNPFQYSCLEKAGRLWSIGSRRVRNDWSYLACMNKTQREYKENWTFNSCWEGQKGLEKAQLDR